MKTKSVQILMVGFRILVAMTFITSCEKETRPYKTSISGYVIEKNGTRIVEGAKVYLFHRTSDGSFSSAPGGPRKGS